MLNINKRNTLLCLVLYVCLAVGINSRGTWEKKRQRRRRRRRRRRRGKVSCTIAVAVRIQNLRSFS